MQIPSAHRNPLRKKFLSLSGVSLLGVCLCWSVFPVSSVHAQGFYYPVSSAATTTTAPVYNGEPYAELPDYNMLDLVVRATAAALPVPQQMSIYNPPPVGYTAPSNAVYESAVNQCVTTILNGGAPGGVTLSSFATAAVQYLPADRANIGNQIARAIVGNYPADSATATSKLNEVVDALASAQPTLMVSSVQGMLGVDSTGKTAIGSAVLNTGSAHAIASVVARAISDIPTDSAGVASLVVSGVNAIAAANLTTVQKTSTLIDSSNGFVQLLLQSSGAQNNQANVASIVRYVLSGPAVNLVPVAGNPPASDPSSSVGQILAAAVAGLQFYNSPTPAQNTLNQYNLIALTNGALASQGATNADAISTLLSSNSGDFSKVSAYSAYSTATVGGYKNGSTAAAFQTYVGTVPNFAAAAASGAVTKTPTLVASFVQYALVAAPSSATRDVVFASVLANPSGVVSAIQGAINPNAGSPVVYGGGTFGDVAWGAYQGGPLTSSMTSMTTLLTKIGSYVASTTNQAAFDAQVLRARDVINGAVLGADAGGKGAVTADLIYQAMVVGRGTPPGYSAQMAAAAVTAVTNSGLGAANNYIAVVAALAGDAGVYRTAIQNATYLGTGIMTTTPGSDITAATNGANLVILLQTNTTNKFVNTLQAFKNAPAQSSVIADLYAAVLANSAEAYAGLAAAIKQTNVDQNLLTTTAINAYVGLNSNAPTTLIEVAKIAGIAKSNALNPAYLQVFGYVGTEIIAYPTLTKEIASAWTVVDPDHAHWVAASVGFSSPNTAANAVASVFQYTQITNPAPLAQPTSTNPTGALTAKSFPGVRGVIIDQPAAAAAITAGFVTGVIESDPTFRFGVGTSAISAATKTNLLNVVGAAVIASTSQSGVNLQGSASPFNDTNAASAGYVSYFRQSDGASTTSYFTSGANTRSTGVAGAVTGFVSQLTYYGDSTISPITAAVITAAGNNAKGFGLQIAQAAAQAFAWVSAGPGAGSTFVFNVANPETNQVAGNVVYDIAKALSGVVTGSTIQQLMYAAYFGITEANNGTIGAGALGLNAKGLTDGTLKIAPAGNAKADFYQHSSATGTPVTNIFNL